jgi:hypothetical protein
VARSQEEKDERRKEVWKGLRLETVVGSPRQIPWVGYGDLQKIAERWDSRALERGEIETGTVLFWLWVRAWTVCGDFATNKRVTAEAEKRVGFRSSWEWRGTKNYLPPDVMGIMFPPTQCVAITPTWKTNNSRPSAVGKVPKTVTPRQCKSRAIRGGEKCAAHSDEGDRRMADDRVREALAALKDVLPTAVQTLVEVMTDGEHDRDRVRAAEAVLDRAGIPARSVVDLQIDMAHDQEIEDLLSKIRGGGGKGESVAVGQRMLPEVAGRDWPDDDEIVDAELVDENGPDDWS